MVNPFKIGLEVRLKSGSPQMTVNEISKDGVFCYWFDGNLLQAAWFHMDAVVLAS